MTRHQQEMYRNIERIAVALETLVIEAKNQKIDTFRKATNVIYGNDHKGRSSDNYQYPSKPKDDKYAHLADSFTVAGMSNDKEKGFSKFQAKMDARTSPDNFQPSIHSQLDDRIYQESQAVTGGEFQSWYHALTPDEVESYRRVYGH